MTSVTFTEYWFRTSGLYDLNREGTEEYALPGSNQHSAASPPPSLVSACRELAEIADVLGDEWSRDRVAKHSRLSSNIVPEVLSLARKHQEGRGTEDVPTGTFTEGWFRTSGLYDLNREGTEEYALPVLTNTGRPDPPSVG